MFHKINQNLEMILHSPKVVSVLHLEAQVLTTVIRSLIISATKIKKQPVIVRLARYHSLVMLKITFYDVQT